MQVSNIFSCVEVLELHVLVLGFFLALSSFSVLDFVLLSSNHHQC
jgi:hypothetical protein